MNVLHIGSENGWRGGENQLRFLIEGSSDRVNHIVAYPRSSLALPKFERLTTVLPLRADTPTSPFDLIRLHRLCRDREIDIIDAHSGNAHTLAVALKALGAAPKLVVHRRIDNAIKRSFPTKQKYTSQHVAMFVAISECIGRVLVDYGIPPERVTVVRSAVGTAAYDALDRSAARAALRKRYQLPVDALLIGNASALTKQKGYPVLLDALGLLRDRGVDFHCAIAGDGALRLPLARQVNNLALGERVHFLGHIEDVPTFLAGLDILAMPSNNEGLGTLLLDAALAGCAIAASDVGGIPEFVRHEGTGLLAPPGDPAAHAANLERLARDAGLRASLNAEADARARTEFSVDTMVEGNLAVYQRVLGGA